MSYQIHRHHTPGYQHIVQAARDQGPVWNSVRPSFPDEVSAVVDEPEAGDLIVELAALSTVFLR
jgi:hypothetical protein